jgi:hypothetical protein
MSIQLLCGFWPLASCCWSLVTGDWIVLVLTDENENRLSSNTLTIHHFLNNRIGIPLNI